MNEPPKYRPFSQKDFQLLLGDHQPFGLCAGLVCAWCDQIQRGHDFIDTLKQGQPSLVKKVLRSQVLSIYLADWRSLRTATPIQRILSHLKYGAQTAERLANVMTIAGAMTELELDLVLQLGLHIHSREVICNFNELSSSFPLLCSSAVAHVFLSRFINVTNGASKGHRCIYAIDNRGIHRFYDPTVGEYSFESSIGAFRWLRDYIGSQAWGISAQTGLSRLLVVNLSTPSPSQASLSFSPEPEMSDATFLALVYELATLADPYTARWLHTLHSIYHRLTSSVDELVQS